MFDKNEQRRRAAEFSKEQLAKGVTAPAANPIPKVEPQAQTPAVPPEAFVNKFGQIILPGQRVVVVAEGYNHAIKVYEGIFVCQNIGARGVTSVSVCVKTTKTRWMKGGVVSDRWQPGAERVEVFAKEVQRAYAAKRVYALA